MIERYTREEMGRIWTDLARWQIWLEIELASCEAWSREGQIPKSVVSHLRKKAKIRPNRIAKIEEEVKHDVIAFVTAVGETVGKESRFLHFGLTSSDVLDSAFAYQLKEAAQLLEKGLRELTETVKKLAWRHRQTLMIGRTHGVHAEPTTFGWKVSGWYKELTRQQKRLAEAKETISVGKISGAVGTYAHVPPRVEKFILSKLGLKSEDVATQVVSRDRHAHYFSVLAGIASSIEKIAVEIRHLARTEVAEVSEAFSKGQKGSSAMPHKKNPILTENLTGLARLVRSYSQAALENVALWHERDISHSSVERVIGPDATIILDFMISRVNLVLKGLVVNEKKMKENLEASGGLCFSQELLLALVGKGLLREKAYRLVQKHALAAWENGEDFYSRIQKDPIIKNNIATNELKSLFDPRRQLKVIEKKLPKTLGMNER